MRVVIIGSGFGLYCYLPALVIGCRQHVVLPDRYRDRLRARADVGSLSDSVEWAQSDELMLAHADCVVVAQRPGDQVDRVMDCLRRDNISCLLLEKPLAPDPICARRLLEEIEISRKRFRIGYIFRYTQWGRALLNRGYDVSGSIHIGWYFRAHHYTHGARNWKRLVSAGGGAVRFYGIHLIALLAEAGYDRVVSSYVGAEVPDEAETWHAVIAGIGLPDCHIDVDTNYDGKLFKVSATRAPIGRRLNFTLSDPLEIAGVGSEFDQRVALLTELCRDFFQDQNRPGDNYRSSITLWRDVEANTRVERVPGAARPG